MSSEDHSFRPPKWDKQEQIAHFLQSSSYPLSIFTHFRICLTGICAAKRDAFKALGDRSLAAGASKSHILCSEALTGNKVAR